MFHRLVLFDDVSSNIARRRRNENSNTYILKSCISPKQFPLSCYKISQWWYLKTLKVITNLNKYSVRKSHALNFVLLLYSGKTGGHIIKMHVYMHLMTTCDGWWQMAGMTFKRSKRIPKKQDSQNFKCYI